MSDTRNPVQPTEREQTNPVAPSVTVGTTVCTLKTNLTGSEYKCLMFSMTATKDETAQTARLATAKLLNASALRHDIRYNGEFPQDADTAAAYWARHSQDVIEYGKQQFSSVQFNTEIVSEATAKMVAAGQGATLRDMINGRTLGASETDDFWAKLKEDIGTPLSQAEQEQHEQNQLARLPSELRELFTRASNPSQ